MTMLRIFILCCSNVGESTKDVLCFFDFCYSDLLFPILGMRLVGFLGICMVCFVRGWGIVIVVYS